VDQPTSLGASSPDGVISGLNSKNGTIFDVYSKEVMVDEVEAGRGRSSCQRSRCQALLRRWRHGSLPCQLEQIRTSQTTGPRRVLEGKKCLCCSFVMGENAPDHCYSLVIVGDRLQIAMMNYTRQAWVSHLCLLLFVVESKRLDCGTNLLWSS
jgi:hypothetical protein